MLRGGLVNLPKARCAVQGRLVAADSSAARLRGLTGSARCQGLADDFLDVRPEDLRELRQELGAASLFDRGAQPPIADVEHARGLRCRIILFCCCARATRERWENCLAGLPIQAWLAHGPCLERRCSA